MSTKSNTSYFVEKVLNKRFRNGGIEYLIERKNSSSWEPVENLDCHKDIEEFEERYKSIVARSVQKENEKKQIEYFKEKEERKRIRTRGFEREPEKIIKVLEIQGELKFLMKWRGCKELDLVSSKEANEICPQIVILFYERITKWPKSHRRKK